MTEHKEKVEKKKKTTGRSLPFSFKPDDGVLVLFEEVKGKERVLKDVIHSCLAPGPTRWDLLSPLKSLSPFFFFLTRRIRELTSRFDIPTS